MKSRYFILLFVTCFFRIQGQQYFQQEVNYKIDVKLDDKQHELSAEESLEYINNSPNTLTFLYFHIWPNAYKDNTSALAHQLLDMGKTDFHYAPEANRGYIDKLDFKVEGQPVKWNYDSTYNDIVKIDLNTPLKPGERIHITTPFHVKIPLGIYSRMGHLGQSYQITQWYPKPAVYDRNGWNQMPYLNQGEFYSEFGSYDVSITLPKNYVVGATGDLVDGEKELQWLDEKVKETEALKDFDYSMEFPASSSELKTLRYKQSKVHDFAWFADKRYHVLKGEVTLPQSGHKVTSWAMFTNAEAKLWKKSIEYINDGLLYYSNWNGDYPYNQATVVDGALTAGAGMEYPNVTVIGTSNTAYNLEVTIVHEIGHNWFYGMLGSNERKHAWMDEGINSFFETRYMLSKYPQKKGEAEVGDMSRFGRKFNFDKLNHKKYKELTYLNNATRNLDQPADLPSDKYTDLNYGGIVYDKSALLFDYLKGYLGDEIFDRCMHAYFETWKFKHPQPEDIHAVFEKESGKKLDWFFKDLITTNDKLDYSITRLKGDSVLVKNKTGLAVPFSIGSYKDGQLTHVKWYDGFRKKAFVKFPVNGSERLKIDPYEEIPEIDRLNNNLNTHGLFPRFEKFKLQPLGSIQNPDRSELYYFPVSGFNEYDKYMYGLLLYNHILPYKRFEYELMPMYSFRNGHVNGGANIGYSFFPHGSWATSIRAGVKFEHFTYDSDPYLMYYKLAPEILVNLRPEEPTATIRSQIRYRLIKIDQQILNSKDHRVFEKHLYNELSYSFSEKRKVNPYSLKLTAEANGSVYGKAMAEASYKLSYKRGKGIDFRWFGGVFVYENIDPSDVFQFHPFQLSGFDGLADYRFDETFIGRSNSYGLLSRQFSEYEGAFKTALPLGIDKWLTTLNVKVAMPGKLPIGLFGDLGTFRLHNPITDEKGNVINVLYDFGAYVSLGGVVEVFFPISASPLINNYYDIQDYQYKEKIRFTLNLSRLNPFELLRNLNY